jgi:hypothetical protein
MDALYGVRFMGPLTPFSRGFAEELVRLGFTVFSARKYSEVLCLWACGFAA